VSFITELVPEPDEFYIPVAVVLDQKNDAGDLLPTIVLPEDARRYIDQVDTDYQRFGLAVAQSSVDPGFKSQWEMQLVGWKAFSIPARAAVGFINTKAVMDQTDRWAEQLVTFSKSFIAAGGTLLGPPPQKPGQGTGDPLTLPSVGSVTGLVAAIAGVAAIVVLGPKLFK
jgi:hypothetical protein